MAGSTTQDMQNAQAQQRRKQLKIWVWVVVAFFWLTFIFPITSNVLSNAIVLPEWLKNSGKAFSDWLFNQDASHAILLIGGLLLLTLIAYLLTRDRAASTAQADTSVAPPLPQQPSVQPPLPSGPPAQPVQPAQPASTPMPVPLPAPPPVNVTVNNYSAATHAGQGEQKQTDDEVQQQYLRVMKRKTLSLNLEGVPTPYQLPNVLLEDVFIDLEFLPRRLDADYELSKEERLRYQELEAQGQVTEEMARVFISAEHNSLRRLSDEERLSISSLWELLSKNRPAMVVQGYPGMGKSTLLSRLTLHLARLGLAEADPLMREKLSLPNVVPVPILLYLREYATEFESAQKQDKAKKLSVLEYLQKVTQRLNIPSVFAWLEHCLRQGRCLLLFDGLDEVSDLGIRRQVRDAIEECIDIYSALSSGENYNRFVITSRVAGYDVVSFRKHEYRHVTVADLSEEQINDFLPRWCRASVPSADVIGNDRHDARLKEAEQTAQRVMDVVATHKKGAGELARNPLLLTLLVILQQNRVTLPKERYKLYETVTTMMLKERNKDKGLLYVPELLAIERLGPLAYKMQNSNNYFTSKHSVKDAICKIIAAEESGEQKKIDEQVDAFLLSVRERSGLFVIRTGDYYGFFHRTLQEYFAARYMLNQIKKDATTWLPILVEHARRLDDLWREPFLLAVAYQSNEDETIAQKILTALLTPVAGASFKQRAHDVLLVAECLPEARELALGGELERRVVTLLMQTYEEAQKKQEFAACTAIEAMMVRLLRNTDPEQARLQQPLLRLVEIICDTQQFTLQRATLTMLAMIVRQLGGCSAIVFVKLVPPLLALAGLPEVGPFQPQTELTTTNYDIVDLALTALSQMGKRGPAGADLPGLRVRFAPHIRQLAQYSLESGTLITPTLVPFTQEAYQQYERAIGQWLQLRDSYDRQHITTQDINTCADIQEALLACTEEFKYPLAEHLLAMLQISANVKASWQMSWRAYIEKQLHTGTYSMYQQWLFFWTLLFRDKATLQSVTTVVLKNYVTKQASPQRYAQRFLASEGRYLSDLRDLRDLRYLRYLRYLTLNTFVVEKALEKLSSPMSMQDNSEYDDSECAELLTILMGRLLQMQEGKEIGPECEREIKQIVNATIRFTSASYVEEVCEAALDVLRYIPMRTVSEIAFVLECVEEANTAEVQQAYAYAITQARPVDEPARVALAAGKRSQVPEVRAAVENVLRRR